jgi:NAD(P)-dependent dehydrogenase (short-subunit alcohol dehydrogenase family)
MSLAGKTLFITGASRGIGLAIALRAARDGANIAIAAKTAEPHPKLAGTIYTAAEDIERAGGKALPLLVDVRDETLVRDALAKTAAQFRRHRYRRQQCQRHPAYECRQYRHEAVRPDARRSTRAAPSSSRNGPFPIWKRRPTRTF